MSPRQIVGFTDFASYLRVLRASSRYESREERRGDELVVAHLVNGVELARATSAGDATRYEIGVAMG